MVKETSLCRLSRSIQLQSCLIATCARASSVFLPGSVPMRLPFLDEAVDGFLALSAALFDDQRETIGLLLELCSKPLCCSPIRKMSFEIRGDLEHALRERILIV